MTDLHSPISRRAPTQVGHGVKPLIVVTLYPAGSIAPGKAYIGLRESGRRRKTEVYVEVGTLYERTVHNVAIGTRLAKAKAKAAERKLRRSLR